VVPKVLAARVAQDVAAIVRKHPDVPVHRVQDGAPDLKVLPGALASVLPSTKAVVTLVDLEHVAGYLDRVVDATQPANDPNDMKSWYRGELLRDDLAIDRILVNLRRLARSLLGRGTAARKAVEGQSHHLHSEAQAEDAIGIPLRAKSTNRQWCHRAHLLADAGRCNEEPSGQASRGKYLGCEVR